MSEDTRTIVIDVEPGLLVGTVWIPKGKSVAAPKSRADVLVKDGHAIDATGQTPDFDDLYPQPTEKQKAAQLAKEEARTNAPTSELIEWPAYTKLNMGGILTVESLKTYIAENGTLWAKKLDLSDDEIVAIEAELKTLDEAITAAESETEVKKTKKQKTAE